MKLKVGNRLLSAREERKMTQAEMAEFLNFSQSAYSRLERNETSVDLDVILKIAEKLEIPIQDFLPETLNINSSNNDNGQVGFVVGNYYNYNDKALLLQVEKLEQANGFLKKENELLRDKISNLEEMLSLYKNQNTSEA